MILKYIQLYKNFLLETKTHPYFLFEANMNQDSWFMNDFKYTQNVLNKLNNQDSTFITIKNTKFSTSDIKIDSLKRVIKFLTAITKRTIKKGDDRFNEWFSNKKYVKGIELKNGTKIPLYQLDKTQSELTGSKMGANYTEKQELGSMLSFQYFIEYDKFPTDEDLEQIYPDVDKSWIKSYQTQVVLLKKWLGDKKGYVYERNTGIMRLFVNLAKHVGIRESNNWCPADIWLTQKNVYNETESFFKKIVFDKLDTDEIKIEKVNTFLREKIKKKEIIPISLKKIGKRQDLDEYNFEGAISDISSYTVSTEKITNVFDYTSKVGFKTKYSSIIVNIEQLNSTIEIKNETGNKKRDDVKISVKTIGRGARDGKVQMELMRKYFDSVNELVPNKKLIPDVGKWTKNDIIEWNRIFTELYNSNFNKEFNIDFGNINPNKFNDILEMAIREEAYSNAKDNVASSLCSKLLSLKYLHIFSKIYESGKWIDFIITIILSAQKRFGIAAPFIIIH